MTSPTPPLDRFLFDDPVLVDLADEVLDLARRLHRGSEGMEGVVPLTGTEVMVLRYIDRHPESTPSAAAEGTGLRRPNLSAALRSLEAKGMIERHGDAADSRSFHLRLTERARVSASRIRARWGQVLSAQLGELTAEEHAVLERAVGILERGTLGPDSSS